MSFSEPASPNKSVGINDKWFLVSSCLDLKEDIKEDRSAVYQARTSLLNVKRSTVHNFLQQHSGKLDEHVEELRQLARSNGGLVEDSLRCIVWPVLARHMHAASQKFADDSVLPEEELKEEDCNTHQDWNQVQLDVHRTLARFPPNINEEERDELQTQLTPLIVKILSGRDSFRYYQGLHDVFLTLLLVVGKEAAEEIGRHLVHKGVFHDYLCLPLERGVLKQLELLFVILWRVDPQLEAILSSANLSPIFALSWPLTWFSHSLHSYAQIVRVFDAFLAGDPLLPIYLSAACVLFRRQNILNTEREMPHLHRLLSTMPAELPIDSLLSDALYLARLIPPSLLEGRYASEYANRLLGGERRAAPLLPRFALQAAVVAGAVSAAAGYYFFGRLIV